MTLEISYEKHGVLTYSQQQASGAVHTDKALSGKELVQEYLKYYQDQVAQKSQEEFSNQTESFSLADIGYTGKPIAQLTQSEAADLVSEDGFFGIKQTSERIANFVIGGAGDDLAKLQAGREGMLQGFKEAEQIWGEKLPEISYTTMQKALEKVDARITELGGKVLDTTI